MRRNSKDETNLAEAVGTECALEAIDGGGSSPFAEDGTNLLPKSPQLGDYDFLDDTFYREFRVSPTEEDEHVFEDAYERTIQDHLSLR